MRNFKVIDQKLVKRNYDFNGVIAIIDSDKYGRQLIQDGYGGESTLRGGAVRFEHGFINNILITDTLDIIINGDWNDFTGLLDAVSMGYDKSRPLLNWDGFVISKIAESLKL